MRAVDLIEKKKRGKKHTEEEIYFLVNGYLSGGIADYQMSAWLMAVCFQGLDIEETTHLTRSYVESGEILAFPDIEGLRGATCASGGASKKIIADKHSTGGVGDKVTLILIPLLAACGLVCAKLSGKGLGYTGGTVDKLDAIPGFNCMLDTEDFVAQCSKIGCAISSQSPNLTPADGKIYALRDVTATVDNKSLICASVVSKKIASGADIIALDVKYGTGAFIKTKEDALELAQLMIDIGKQLGKKISAVITSMEQPLGTHIGNALEVIESIEFLKGRTEADLKEVCFELGAVLLAQTGLNRNAAYALMEEKIANGEALEKFREMVAAQGGEPDITEDYSLLPTARGVFEVCSVQGGTVLTLDALKVAKACKILGAGRDKKEDEIDYATGVVLKKKIGDSVSKGEVLAVLHYNSDAKLNEAAALIEEAYEISTGTFGKDTGSSGKDELIYKVL